jgi:hypothetical protein
MARFDTGLRLDAGVRLDAPNPAPKNMSQNLISQAMTDVQRDAMVADLVAFETKWAPYDCPLTPTQIAGLARMSPGDIGLLDLALTFAQQNPTALPSGINLTEFAKDIALIKQVAVINAKTQQHADRTRCTMIAGMSDGFKTGRDIYRVAQAMGRTPENTAFLDAFGARFARGPQAAPTKNPAP